MSLTTGMEAINAKIQPYGKLKAEIRSIDVQESYNGGVVVLVTGYMVKEVDLSQSFTQKFFLAPQKVGFFVLNDIFRYMEDTHSQQENENLANVVVQANQGSSSNHYNQTERQRVPANQEVINREIYVNMESEAYNSKGNSFKHKGQVPPKEPTLSCPVCIGPLVEEMSTR